MYDIVSRMLGIPSRDANSYVIYVCGTIAIVLFAVTLRFILSIFDLRR